MFSTFFLCSKTWLFFLLQQRKVYFHTLLHGISRNKTMQLFSAVTVVEKLGDFD
eukprot:TRINITY_DN3306_c1_g1_i3.p3 TRINITY_DN3306_c1_g1~~TRINITY_DN3306_c1_g1_i3.p3  ORF type:complete len:54 (+),score=2.65 TRINITY_DN3306_c1_g1_i3:450-611(+)